MLITFNIFKNNTTWSANIHQLNSDILQRLVLANSPLSELDLDFSFCEATSMGSITGKDNSQVGEFIVFF
ncbi:hypothetical protein BIY22_00930 [Vibrio panuliri]|uniref:Uncharacterized protein n=1 Tax=Vibrio panuliri TaxID=1381081 RepID=A0A1Q9HQD4_9VIBR|nr:hypothetical protein F7O85_09630 [Vibrio panuliri]OLQ93087.1 hypothetical protein BIY22_00930 [Vibrio panuliri]OLQ96596.1 hypothetical protein BIY20_18580 [Vibrio panuliri]